MVEKRRIQRIERVLKPLVSQGIRREIFWYTSYVRYTLSHHYIEDPDEPNREIFCLGGWGDQDNLDDKAIIEAMKLDLGLSAEMIRKVQERSGDESTIGCVEVIDIREGVFLVCSKKDWKSIYDEHQCCDCKSLRLVYEMVTVEELMERKRQGIPWLFGIPSDVWDARLWRRRND